MRRYRSDCVVQVFVVATVLAAASAASAQMKVACVGDSITAPSNGWCSHLGKKLGSGYMTKTFGVSGTTLLKNVPQPSYFNSAQFKPSHDYAPNIVVIMLGTNDSATRNWNAGKDHFVKDYEELIDSYTSLATKPTVILNTPPPASDNNQFTITGTTIEKEINPLIKQVAMNKMCPVADVWAAFDGDVEKLSSFDGVHPGDAGQMVIAETVYKVIMSLGAPGASAGMGGSAGMGASAGAGGRANAAAAGSSAIPGLAGAGGTSAGGANGGSANAGTASAGLGGTSAGVGGDRAGGAATSSAGGSTGSTPTSMSASLAGAPGRLNAGSSSSVVNAVGVAGTGAPPASAPQSSDGGCSAAGSSTSNGGPTAALLLLLGLVLRSSKRVRRTSLMRRNIANAIVRLSVVVLMLTAAGVAHAQVKVACVGDSITALPSSWCGTLSTKLGSGYMVKNFGVSGTNLAKGVSQPYWNSAQYKPSHDFAPNIVIIMLGTNDAFQRSWGSAKAHFVADYKELLDTYTSLASKPKPYMIIPTPIGTSPFGHDGNLLATEVVPLVKQVAVEKMVPTIDALTLFGGAMFDTSLFSASDQVHPNAKGQQKLGEEVYKVLMSTGALDGSATAGSDATPGTNAGAGTGAGGMTASAGAVASAGRSAAAGAAGIATAGASANAGGAGSGAAAVTPTGAAGSGASATVGARAGSSATPSNSAATAGSTSSVGVPTAGSTASSVNSIGAAGSAAVATAPQRSGDDGGCRVSGSSTRNAGPTAALTLLLGLLIRRRRKSARATSDAN